MSESTKEVIEKLETILDTHDSALRFNLHQVVRHFIWKLCMENDSNSEYKEGYKETKNKLIYMAGDLDRIIDTVIETSHYTDREDGENYPVWNEHDVDDEMERVMRALIKAGVAIKE